ncbi:protoheme IX farnesyltransferase, mitochondrial [Diorhabda sublineata]|uniref:protoheme IX farnesyltransferase, mitochondrial n=1 Tax=Diorhabda sublineata TaxID=1163346 RepID=UPI0024E179D3|nr:protoheme IX farnesyltransferase, mitochondrial [Diorhabda sublineata]
MYQGVVFNLGLHKCLSTSSVHLFKQYKFGVNFIVPSTNYVNKTNTKSSPPVLVDISQNETLPLPDFLPHKPKIEPSWQITPCTNKSNVVSQYLKLSKIRLTSLVVITSMAGYAVAPAPFEVMPFLMCATGTALLSAAANAINQFHEVPFDAQMSRTKNRVIVCGKLTPLHAMVFAATTSITGLGILYYGVNGLTASLGLTNLLLYTSVYTPLKRISILNTWVGSVVGAIPPLMGWAACANSLGPGAWLMAALLYSWQFPHFNALSWNLRPDYSRAGYRMMAVTEPGLCRRVALRHTIAIQAMSVAAPLLDTTNWWFLLESTPLNLYFIYLAYKFYKESSSATSRKLFRFSLIHLPLIMILFLVNKKKWFLFEGEENDISRTEVVEV